MMQYCKFCGGELSADDCFCGQCGQTVNGTEAAKNVWNIPPTSGLRSGEQQYQGSAKETPVFNSVRSLYTATKYDAEELYPTMLSSRSQMSEFPTSRTESLAWSSRHPDPKTPTIGFGSGMQPAVRRRRPLLILVIIAVVSAVIISGITGFVLINNSDLNPPLVVPAKLAVTPLSLDFGKLEQGVKLSLPVSISNTGGKPLSWNVTEETGSAEWLAVQTTSATIEAKGHQQDEVMVDASHLPTGNISAFITINSNGGKKQVIIKADVLHPGSPKLNVIQTSLNFGTRTTAVTVLQQTILVTNGGTMVLKWQANAGNASWLTLDTNSGTIWMLQPGGKQAINVTVTKGLAPGAYTATVIFTSNGGDQRVPVSLVVISPPPSLVTPTQGSTTPVPVPARLVVTPTSLAFNELEQGTTAMQHVTVSNAGGQLLNWSLDRTSLPDWLSVDTSSGTIQHDSSQPINVTANTANLSPGSYSASVNFTSNGGKAQVSVILSESTPTPTPAMMSVSPNPLDFGAMDPGTTTTLQTTINNDGGQTLNWNVDSTSLPGWLSVDTTSGTVQADSSQTINVTANTSTLSTGSDTATLNFTSNGGDPQVQVTLTVNPPLAVMVVSPNPLDFGTVTAGNTSSIPETVSNSGGQPLDWSLDTSSLPSWLSVDTTSGTVQAGGTQTINVTANTSTLSTGSYSFTFNFTSSNGGGSAQVPVTITVQ